ncbi:alpha/beta hydrolase [Pinirhizobacter soli]|uniref:alpha/beta hydrolase n=1 Tax=Pinirhizobacter soli TaxID=2786953 RepID=UPI00202A40E6|nr:alpha/beta hydrolase [Pinirhizobacter soli]
MKLWVIAVCLLAACGSAHAQTNAWQPAAGYTQTPIWPGPPPDSKPMPGPEDTWTNQKDLIGGKTVSGVKNVSQPTMTVYAPKGENTGAAVVVFPGGGFEILAMDLEGTDVCDWLTAKGVTCVLLKYRVPSIPYEWQCDCRPHNLQLSMPSLQDAQRTIRLVRSRAAEWHIDPHKVGVLGFSAGGFLVAEVSTNFKRQTYKPVDAADKESSRPDFALAIYPGHVATDRDTLNPNLPFSHASPPTFLLQAEDDHVDGVHQTQVYYAALKNADVPVEMHLYPHGGHAFGLRPTENPITHWPALAETWMGSIGMIPVAAP